MTRKILAMVAVMTVAAAAVPSVARADHKDSRFSINVGFGTEDGYVRIGYQKGGPVCAPSPAPDMVRPYPAPRPRFWTPAHYETRTITREVPGYWNTAWVPPVYGTSYDPFGRPYAVVLQEGRWVQTWVPSRMVCEQVQVLVSGQWGMRR
ncbi:MAG: hypothetical protein AAB215_07585 [Planctomycetota bacterium]